MHIAQRADGASGRVWALWWPAEAGHSLLRAIHALVITSIHVAAAVPTILVTCESFIGTADVHVTAIPRRWRRSPRVRRPNAADALNDRLALAITALLDRGSAITNWVTAAKTARNSCSYMGPWSGSPAPWVVLPSVR